MPYIVKSARLNKTVIVQITVGGEERTVNLRGGKAAISSTLTADMRTQSKMRYITCKRVDVGDDATLPDVGQGSVIAAIDQHEAEMRGEANPPPSETEGTKYFTEEEIDHLKKSQLLKLIEAHPTFKIDPVQSKTELQGALKKFSLPKMDLEE